MYLISDISNSSTMTADLMSAFNANVISYTQLWRQQILAAVNKLVLGQEKAAAVWLDFPSPNDPTVQWHRWESSDTFMSSIRCLESLAARSVQNLHTRELVLSSRLLASG